MSKTKTLKKSILSWIAVWLVFTAAISIMAAIFYKNGYFHSPTEEEYAELIEYVEEVEDNMFKYDNIRNRFFFNENMSDIFVEISEGDVDSKVEITADGIFIRAEEANCIVEKEYELIKEYVQLEDGTRETEGIILAGKNIVQSRNTVVRDLVIAIYVIITAVMLLALFTIIYSEKKNKKKA